MEISSLNSKFLRAGTREAFSVLENPINGKLSCLDPENNKATAWTELSKESWTEPSRLDTPSSNMNWFPKKKKFFPSLSFVLGQQSITQAFLIFLDDYLHRKAGISTLKNFQLDLLEVSKLQLCWLECANDFLEVFSVSHEFFRSIFRGLHEFLLRFASFNKLPTFPRSCLEAARYLPRDAPGYQDSLHHFILYILIFLLNKDSQEDAAAPLHPSHQLHFNLSSLE